MKRLISLIAVVAMLATMFSFSVSAADTLGTLTMTVDAVDNKASQGDEFIASVTLDTSNGIKGFGFKIAFDPDDIELGLSTSAKEVNLDDYAEFIGTPDFPTTESVYEALISHKSYVDDTYFSTYGSYASNKKFGDPTIGYEEKDGTGYVGFGYAGSAAKNALTKIDNMAVAGAVLKVKTAEKKQTTINILEATAAGSNGVDTPSVVNSITLNLNGYGEVVEPEVPTAEDLGLFTDANQNFKVTDKVMTSNGYSIEKALGFVSGINVDAAVVKYGTEITCEGFDKVLDIPAANSYEASETVKGFVAAVTSIRKENLTKTFTAKAYADVTVGEETVRIYATDAATAVYGN